jgi:hypothetical protein
VKKPFVLPFVLLAVLFICGHVLAQTQQQAIPNSFFGQHVNNPTLNGESSYPVQVTYGELRNWDVYLVSWPDIEPTCAASGPNPGDQCFTRNGQSTWGPLQTELEAVMSAGVTNVMFTLSRTPSWAVTANQKLDSNCNYYRGAGSIYDGACYAPILPLVNGTDYQLKADGTGEDLTWRNWVGAVATYVNGSTWCGSTCAKVKYWEIWNEFTRNSLNQNTADPHNTPPKVSWFTSTDSTNGCTNGPCPTIDQLIRMTEDARCVITGQGTVDNYPNAGDHTSCADLHTSHGWPGPIDTTAEIVQPSVTYPSEPDSLNSLQCYLYCGTTAGEAACTAWNKTPQCANSWPNAASAVDILNFHGYTEPPPPYSQNPEEFFSSSSSSEWGSISKFEGKLQGQDANKPLWMGEGSFGNTFQNSSNWWQDEYAQGGYVAKYFAALWSNFPSTNGCSWTGTGAQVCQQAFWYGYDHDVTVNNSGWKAGSFGALYCPGKSQAGYCGSGPPNYTPFLITPQTTMWDVAVGWLTGAVPTASPFCNNDTTSGRTVWHCDFTKGSTHYSMVWDNTNAGPGVNCSSTSYPSPLICGNTQYPVPSQFAGGSWVDLGPTFYDPLGAFVTIGLNPILLVK